MIELPADPAPNGANPQPIDNGFTQKGPGGPALRIDKPGSHWAIEITFPPMKVDVARKFSTRLTWAMSEGLRIDVPLLGVSQGSPGSPVVDGAEQSGNVLNIRGLTPYYAAKEGFWLHIEDADGERDLHQVKYPAVADAAGMATYTIWPGLRAPFADGATIELARPTIEGDLQGFAGWALSPDRLVRYGGSIVIEESA